MAISQLYELYSWKSRTTFWWEQPFCGCAWVSRAWVLFKKSLSLSHSPIYRAFEPLSLLLTFHKRFTPGLWKRCETSAPLRARRKHPRTFIYRDFQHQLWKWKQFFEKCFLKKCLHVPRNTCKAFIDKGSRGCAVRMKVPLCHHLAITRSKTPISARVLAVHREKRSALLPKRSPFSRKCWAFFCVYACLAHESGCLADR